jgi:hypothetical protein
MRLATDLQTLPSIVPNDAQHFEDLLMSSRSVDGVGDFVDRFHTKASSKMFSG